MAGNEWAQFESAWRLDPLHLPRKTDLPALLANADRAVHAAVQSLAHGCDRAVARAATPPPPQAASLADSSVANNGSHLQTAASQHRIIDVEDDDSEDTVNWAQVYESLCLIQAPMVRCSRPAFRQVCRQWGTRISYTHMLIAESFVKSPHARHAEFARYAGEDRLVVQLAAKGGPAAAQAAVLVRPYCDAVDLNCGCPQRWATKEGIGAALLEKPELVADMVRSIRNATPEGNGDTPALPCVVKMRVKADLRHSIDFARQCEAAGAAWVTVHGRTPQCQPSAEVRFEDVQLLRESVHIPVVLNGGVSDVSSTLEAALRTGCGGLMAANGLLDNPALFYSGTSASAMEAEMTFGHAPEGAWAEEASDGDAALCGSSPFTPIQPVSFLWAPQRAVASTSLPSSSPPPVLVRYTVPTMHQAVVTPREVISDFVRAAIRTDLTVPTTVQQVLRMARMYVSPAERNHLALLRSNLSVLRCLQEIGVYVDEGHIPCE